MDVLKKPFLTEKIAPLNEKGLYAFVVDKKANKIQIKLAVEEQYNVSVSTVRTMVCRGKTKTRYTKSGAVSGKKSSYKKALVKLADGEFIDFYSEF